MSSTYLADRANRMAQRLGINWRLERPGPTLAIPLGREGAAKIAIITITEREFRSARRLFGASENVLGTPYRVRQIREDRKYDIVVMRGLDRSNIPVTDETARLINDWRPAYIFVCGTAGGAIDTATGKGRNGTTLGDIVVGDFVDYVEFTKLTPKGYIRRTFPLDHPSLCLRGDYAEALRDSTIWHEYIDVGKPGDPAGENTGPPTVHVGGIAAGERVWGSPNSEQQQAVMQDFDKALAFEMETAGVARAVCRARRNPRYNPQYLTVRGISDFINAASADEDRDRWTEYAATAALAFTRALVENLLAANGGER